MTSPEVVHCIDTAPKIDAEWFSLNRVQIAKFEQVFVLSYSKRVMDRRTPLPWIAHPTSLDSRGYHATFDAWPGETATALYGTFLNLVKLSTLSPPYGSLAHSDGEPFKLAYIENRTRIPRGLIIQAVEWFLKIGWLEVVSLLSCSCHDAVMTTASHRPDHDTERNDTTRTTERNESAHADSVLNELPGTADGDKTPAALLNLIAHWNTLATEGLVPHSAESDPPSKAVLKAWAKSQRVPELRDALPRLTEIETAIRGSPFCREGWFRLEKLIAGTNKDGEFIALKLIDGGYADQANRRRSNSLNTLSNWKPNNER